MSKKSSANEALIISCPRCFVIPFARCISQQTGLTKRWPHPARTRAYLQEIKDRP